jgi:hypothetical protein
MAQNQIVVGVLLLNIGVLAIAPFCNAQPNRVLQRREIAGITRYMAYGNSRYAMRKRYGRPSKWASGVDLYRVSDLDPLYLSVQYQGDRYVGYSFYYDRREQ